MAKNSGAQSVIVWLIGCEQVMMANKLWWRTRGIVCFLAPLFFLPFFFLLPDWFPSPRPAGWRERRVDGSDWVTSGFHGLLTCDSVRGPCHSRARVRIKLPNQSVSRIMTIWALKITRIDQLWGSSRPYVFQDIQFIDGGDILHFVSIRNFKPKVPVDHIWTRSPDRPQCYKETRMDHWSPDGLFSNINLNLLENLEAIEIQGTKMLILQLTLSSPVSLYI